MMGRTEVDSDKPASVYIVTDGSLHRLYSTVGAARGIRTKDNKWWRGRKTFKIYKVDITPDEWEEVE